MYIVIRILNGYCKLLKDSFNQAWLTMAKQYDSWLRWPHAAANMRDHTHKIVAEVSCMCRKNLCPLLVLIIRDVFPGCVQHTLGSDGAVEPSWPRSVSQPLDTQPTHHYATVSSPRYASPNFASSHHHITSWHSIIHNSVLEETSWKLPASDSLQTFGGSAGEWGARSWLRSRCLKNLVVGGQVKKDRNEDRQV